MTYFDDPVQASLREEFRSVLASKLTEGMTRDQVIDAVTRLFYKVEDTWDEVDVTALNEYPGSSFIKQRTLILHLPRQSGGFTVPPPQG